MSATACATPGRSMSAKRSETVFRVLAKHISKGQADKVAGELPAEIRALWPSDAQRAAGPQRGAAELERAS